MNGAAAAAATGARVGAGVGGVSTPSQPQLSMQGQQGVGGASAATALPSPSAADRTVLEYLRKRGYKRAEEALMQHDLAGGGGSSVDIAIDEAEVDDDLRNVVLMLSRPEELAESDARRYEESYCELRDWVDGSLDLYKAELHSVLYPLLVHCFLEMVRRAFPEEARNFLKRCGAEFYEDAGTGGSAGRKEELLSLEGVSTTQHLEENKTAVLFLSNRYGLCLSSYAYELVLFFLADDPRRAVLLRILNQRCRMRLDADADLSTGTRGNVTGGGDGSAGGSNGKDADGDAVMQGDNEGKSGGFVSGKEKGGLLKHEVLWGVLRREHVVIPDADEDDTIKKKDGDKNAGDADKKGAGSGADGDKKSNSAAEGDKKSDANADKGDASGGGAESEVPRVLEDGTISASKIPLKRQRPGAPGVETEADMRARMALGTRNASKMDVDDADKTRANAVFPSVLCYTFTNTKGEGLNCSAVSSDGAQVIGGFGDSSVRIWDARGTDSSGEGSGLRGRPRRLIGHSGAVYSVAFTPCARFSLSASADGSVRLWHVGRAADLSAYKGHNYPVWCVRPCPTGHYFVTGGHDRTARIWTTDRIHALRILAGHLADVDSVQWHPNCNYVATGSSDRTARLWDVREGAAVRVFGTKGTVHALAFSPDGTTLATAGDGGAISMWDLRSGGCKMELRSHDIADLNNTIWALDYSKCGAVLASGAADCSVGLWHVAGLPQLDNSQIQKRLLKTKNTPVHDVMFTKRNVLIASGNYDGAE